MDQERRSWTAVAGLSAVFAFVMGLTGIHCLDVWMHLRTGAVIVESGAIPVADVLSHTRPGAPWVTHEWLFELILLGIWKLGGVEAVVVCKALLAAATAALLVLAARRLGTSPVAAGAAVTIAILVAQSRILARPHMASALLTAGLLWLGFRHLRSADRRLWWAVPTVMLWAQLHSGVLVGLGVLGAIAIEDTWRRRRLGTAAAVTAVSAVAVLVNPHGWQVYWYPVFLLSANDSGAFDLLELRPPLWPSLVHIHAAVVAVAALLAWRRAGPATWIIALAGLAIGLSRIRGAIDQGVMTAPLLALGIGVLVDRIQALRRPVVSGALVAAGGIATVLAVGHRPTLQVDPWAIPDQAMDFVAQAGLGGQMFNSHAFGAWLLWTHPEHPVYWDGRNEVFVSLFQETGDTPVSELAVRYDLGFAVLEYAREEEQREVELEVDLADRLVADPEWVLVWFDDVARVYARRRTENLAAIERYGYRYLRPGWTDLSYLARYQGDAEALAEMEAEARRAVRDATQNRVARMHLAEVLRLEGRLDEAMALLAASDPDDVFVAGRMGAILLQQGRAADAIPHLSRALEQEPENGTLWNNLGLAHLRSGQQADGIAAFERVVELDPRLLAGWDNLAMATRAAGQVARADEASAQAAALRKTLAREAFDGGQLLLEQGLAERAAVEFGRCTELAPSVVNCHYLLGVACNAAGLSDQALAALSMTLQLQPGHPYARLELATALAALGQVEAAREQLQAFLAQGPEERWAAVARARLAELGGGTP